MTTTSTTGTVSVTGLTKGLTYSFKVSGVNIIGEGPLSTNLTLVAAEVPSQMSPITLSLSGTFVQINFTAPDNQGSPITAYSIQMLNKNTGNYENIVS